MTELMKFLYVLLDKHLPFGQVERILTDASELDEDSLNPRTVQLTKYLRESLEDERRHEE